MPLVPARFTPPPETEEIPPKTRSSTMSFKLVPARFPPQILPKTRKSKKQMNLEYAPFLKFALERNRHPSPEDTKHLAEICGVSYVQITDWFRYHGSRQDTPAKSKRVRPPAPKTFEEMKERLGRSAREALRKAHPLLKKLNLAPTEHHGDTPPESSTRAVSPGVPEDAPSPGSCSDERVELTDHGLLGTAVHQPPISVEEHTPVAHSDNPLNHPETSVHAYPAVYQSSQLTSDPLVVPPHAWLRRANTREPIDTTAEAVADTPSGFDRMDIDEPSEKMKKSRKKFNSSEKMKKSRKKFNSSEKMKKSRKKFNSSEKMKKSRKKFNSDYVPLLELAFENNRFPVPDDIELLADISRNSYRQVKVWFQNRRFRQDTPPKSKRVRPPAPKTFEEMKERLSDSAREALSQAYPLLKELNLAPSEHHGDTPPESSTRAVSSGPPEDAPSPGSCSDERVELTDYGLFGTAVYQPPISVEEHTPLPHSDNPLNPLKTSVHAYPAVYEPSQFTSDPFVVAPHAWLRDRRTNTRESIDPTAEVVADTLSGSDHMDIDEPSAKMKGGRLPRNASSELYGIWVSNQSTIPLPCSSRAGLSPLFSDAERPTSSEALEAHLNAPSGCIVEMPQNSVSLASGASSGASTK